MRPRIAWFDLETTGLPPFEENNVRIIEVAVVCTHGDTFSNLDDGFSQLVHPERDIPPRVTQITKIDAKTVADAPKFKAIADKLFQLMDGAVWAGHNVLAFDIPLLEREFKLAGLPAPKCAGVIDTLLVARDHFKGRVGLADQRLGTLCHYMGVLQPRQQVKHRAIYDVDLTIKLAKTMFAQLFIERNYPFSSSGNAVLAVDENKQKAERCQAKTRGSDYKEQCRNPAAKGGTLCRLHVPSLFSAPSRPAATATAAGASTSPPTRPS